MGEDVSELLDMIAAQMKVIYYPAVDCLQSMRGQIARIKKSCRRCEKMVQEPAPSRPLPGSMAGPNLLAHILVSKFDDHLPLYRQHEIFARMGADIPESTLVGWVKIGPEGTLGAGTTRLCAAVSSYPGRISINQPT